MESKNLLEKWHKKLFWESSYLNPNARFKRNLTEYVYDILKLYFGIEYFKTNGPQIVSSENENWLFYLLGRNDESAIIALQEICNLLIYSTSLEEEIQTKLLSVKQSPAQFREALFEIYIFALLDKIKLQIRKKNGKKAKS